MSKFKSFLAPFIESFVAFQEAAERWNGTYGQNLRLFDRHCQRMFPDNTALTQEMVDSWCAQRETEINNSCRVRVYAISNFISYLRDRGETDVTGPCVPKIGRSTFIPHAFTGTELGRFFSACDHLPRKGNPLAAKTRRLVIPVFFRLLYSSGLRTCEARLLRVGDVDMSQGVLNIRKSKGHSQHYVALHGTMADLLRRYSHSIKAVHPEREFFFPSGGGSLLTNSWVSYNFRQIWHRANPSRATAYELRHNYAVENINQWVGDGFEVFSKMACLSKSMGHASVESTMDYFHLVPALSNIVLDLTGAGFDIIVPEVRDEKGYE